VALAFAQGYTSTMIHRLLCAALQEAPLLLAAHFVETRCQGAVSENLTLSLSAENEAQLERTSIPISAYPKFRMGETEINHLQPSPVYVSRFADDCYVSRS
jgi:hypothetical protein